MAAHGSKEETLNRVEQKGGEYEERFGNCAQGTLLALQEEFKLGDSTILKAVTAMPGIASRGETCGAVVGALLALGMVFGRDNPEDFEGYTKALRPARRFCHAFEKEFGSLMCSHVHTELMGKTYDLADPTQAQEFMKAGGLKICRAPAGKAARFAAEIILKKEA